MSDKVEIIDERPVIEVVDNRFIVEVSAPGPVGPAYYGEGGPVEWATVLNKPTTFPAAPHTHAWTTITDKPIAFTPTAHTHTIADTTGLQAALDAAGGSPSWASITDKPSTFTPSAHTHVVADVSGLQATLDAKAASGHTHIIANVTGLQTALDGKAATSHTHAWTEISGKPTSFIPVAHTHAWTEVTDKPTTFVPSAHGHAIADVSGLQDALDNAGGTPTWTSITDKPTTFAPSAHTHAQADVTGLTDSLAGKAAVGHTHGISDVTNLTNLLSGKASTSHTHPDLSSAINDRAVATDVVYKAGLGQQEVSKDTKFTGMFTVNAETIYLKSTTTTPVAGQVWTCLTDEGLGAWSTPTGGGGGSTAWADITGKPTTFDPIIGTTSTTAKAGDYAPTWTEVTSKPTTFAPIIGTTSTTAKAGDYVPAWSEITSKPSTFTPSAHVHAVSDITATGTADATTYLRGDGSWTTPAGGGGSSSPWQLFNTINTSAGSTIRQTGGTGTFVDSTALGTPSMLIGNTTANQITRAMANFQDGGLPMYLEVEVYMTSGAGSAAGLSIHNAAVNTGGAVSIRADKLPSTLTGNVAIDVDGTTVIDAPAVTWLAGWNKLGVVYWRNNGLCSVWANGINVSNRIVKAYNSDLYVWVGVLHYSANGNTGQHVRNLKSGIIKGGF